MARKIPQKGPHRMKTARKPEGKEDIARRQFEIELNAFATKVHRVIQKARHEMGDAEVEEADREAKAILEKCHSLWDSACCWQC